jgi:catechol 2,3-dioxygenase-like lactoylglutathione lyase family enzyme
VKVKRVVSNVAVSDVEMANAFYKELSRAQNPHGSGLDTNYGSAAKMTLQLRVMSGGESGTAVRDISIEVDDFEDALTRVEQAAVSVEYGSKREPWGVRRFYVRDPFGKLINIVQHE